MPVFITGNIHKFNEVRAILPEVEREDIDLDETQGDESKIVEHKVKSAYKILKRPVFVEDVSLKVEAF
jgi:inosine/xanthosine triphosphate pyrophosphatase family protein